MKCYLQRLFTVVNNYTAFLRPLAPVTADRNLSLARIRLDNKDEQTYLIGYWLRNYKVPHSVNSELISQ